MQQEKDREKEYLWICASKDRLLILAIHEILLYDCCRDPAAKDTFLDLAGIIYYDC
jgi:hypothetical protein